MFLDVLRRRNPGLVEQAIALHQSGAIPANSYLIDLDAVTTNATLIKSEADKVGLKVFAMTKQMGRNGDFCRAVLAGGIDKAVAVDMECARACTAAGLDLGHVGHLALLWQILIDGPGEEHLTVRAPWRGRSGEEIENGLPDGRHARLWRRAPDSFFSVPLP